MLLGLIIVIYIHLFTLKFQNQVEEEIEKALVAFQTNNKMPSAVMEAR
jgi:hypothetical protein